MPHAGNLPPPDPRTALSLRPSSHSRTTRARAVVAGTPRSGASLPPPPPRGTGGAAAAPAGSCAGAAGGRPRMQPQALRPPLRWLSPATAQRQQRLPSAGGSSPSSVVRYMMIALTWLLSDGIRVHIAEEKLLKYYFWLCWNKLEVLRFAHIQNICG